MTDQDLEQLAIKAVAAFTKDHVIQLEDAMPLKALIFSALKDAVGDAWGEGYVEGSNYQLAIHELAPQGKGEGKTMTDQELQQLAGRTSNALWTSKEQVTPACYTKVILSALKKAVEAKDNIIATLQHPAK